jgi:hypothetical protein
VLCATGAVAQERPAANPSEGSTEALVGWEPLGPIPVDQAGAGRRGYVLAGEGAEITGPGANQLSFHTVAANNFYREERSDFLISQRFEAHTVALDYRRGVKVRGFPRFEFGGQVQFHESDSGVLNGFISGFEAFWTSMTGSTSATNQLRLSAATLPPLGMVVTRDGRSLYRAAGDVSGFGDVSLVAKALVRDCARASNDACVAVRIALNLSGKSEFTQGNFAGVGVSLDRRLSNWAALHGDARASVPVDRVSQVGLPLKRASLGFSAGPELKLARTSSISLQIDGNTTPYQPTGTAAFDAGYGAVTLGLNHQFGAGRRRLLAQIYARENMDLPFRVRWNTDPDFAVGIKVTLH